MLKLLACKHTYHFSPHHVLPVYSITYLHLITIYSTPFLGDMQPEMIKCLNAHYRHSPFPGHPGWAEQEMIRQHHNCSPNTSEQYSPITANSTVLFFSVFKFLLSASKTSFQENHTVIYNFHMPEMFTADEDCNVQWLTSLCNFTVAQGRIPDDWKSSILLPVFKGKGDPMECGSHRAIKLLEHAMEVIERVFKRRIREKVKIDAMQFGFMPRKGITDAIFTVWQCKRNMGVLWFCRFLKSIW